MVITSLVECSEVKPDFRDVGVDSNSSRVGVKSISVLIDLVVKYTDGTPVDWVTTVAVTGVQ